MSIHVDQIIEGLWNESLTLEAACQALLSESQADPARTRYWGERIEAAMARNRISRSAARAMLDALEGFQSDKTVWIDSGLLSPVTRSIAGAPTSQRLRDAERLLNAFVERTAQKPASTAQSMPPASGPLTGPVEWFDSASVAEASAALPADPDNIAPGSVVKDRYRIVAHLGAGGIGQVFDAIDLTSPVAGESHVTVKVVAVNLRHEPSALATLETEVRRTQHMVHANIVRLHDIDRHGDRVFIVMESLRGRWLSSLVREARGKGMAQTIAWPIISGIANGLAFAHAHGIVHSDLSPHAVFLCDDGTPKIMGFGLVNALPTSNESLDVLDTLTLRAYTEAYAADPWANQGKPHPADDLYPLGVIAYEMLTGSHPFQRCSLAVARQKGLQFAPIAGLNRRAAKLLKRCLSFDRSDRPRNADSFLRHLQPGLLERMLPAGA